GLSTRGLAARGLLLRGRPLRTLFTEQFGSTFVSDLLGIVALAQRGVVLAVGDVRAEPAILDNHRFTRGGIVAQFLQRRLRRSLAASTLRLRVQLQRVVERDVEDLLLRLPRPRVGATL